MTTLIVTMKTRKRRVAQVWRSRIAAPDARGAVATRRAISPGIHRCFSATGSDRSSRNLQCLVIGEFRNLRCAVNGDAVHAVNAQTRYVIASCNTLENECQCACRCRERLVLKLLIT